MPRVPTVAREALPQGKRHIYDEIRGSRGEVAGPFPVLLNSPDAAQRIAHLGTYIRFESSLPPVVKELVILTTAREWSCQYEWGYHEPEARKVGVREEVIRSIRDRKAPKGLTDEEAVVVRYVLETIQKHEVSEETFQAALKRFGPQGVVDLTATLGYYALLAGVLNTFHVQVDPGRTPKLPL